MGVLLYQSPERNHDDKVRNKVQQGVRLQKHNQQRRLFLSSGTARRAARAGSLRTGRRHSNHSNDGVLL